MSAEPNLTITIRLDQEHRKIEANPMPIVPNINAENIPNANSIKQIEHEKQPRNPQVNPPTQTATTSGLFYPITNDSSNKLSFGLSNPIPTRDNFDLKSMKCADYWKGIKWKNRFDSDEGKPDRFFNSNIFERWRQAWMREIPHYRQALVMELQKYEEKPYPSRCEFFLRSSLRMVEIDFITDNQFSEPRKNTGEKLVGANEILYYVDFAGAPGGVIEFYQKKRKWANKGFGVTYQKRCYDLYAIPELVPEYFEAFYGKLNSLNGDGSLFCLDTINTFINRVKDATDGKGAHVVTTIGNVSRVVFEDDNDEKWKYQHLAQILVALLILREGGNMAFKMYDIKSAFTAGLLYILYRCFEQLQISKLYILAPTTSERVILCVGKKSNEEISEMIKYLQECHKVMADWYSRDKLSYSKMTIEEIIPFHVLESHTDFMGYLRESNDRLKRLQLEEFLISLKNIKTQGSIFSKGLYRALVAKTTEIWPVGDRPNFNVKPPPPRNAFVAFKDLRVFPEGVCEAVETLLNEYNLYTIFASAQHWKFLPVGNQCKSTRGFYLGLEGMPHFYNTKYKEWIPVRDHEFRLPGSTLLYGQIITVFSEDMKQGEDLFSIIDAMVLAGEDIRNLTYDQRMRQCEKFCLSVTKTFFPRMLRLTVTKAYNFAKLPEFLNKIESATSDQTDFPSLCSSSSGSMDAKNKTLILPAHSILSERFAGFWKQRWYNPSGVLFFEADNGTKATDFCSSLFSRVYWEWVSEMDLPLAKPVVGVAGAFISNQNITGDDTSPIGSVSARKLVDFVNRYS